MNQNLNSEAILSTADHESCNIDEPFLRLRIQLCRDYRVASFCDLHDSSSENSKHATQIYVVRALWRETCDDRNSRGEQRSIDGKQFTTQMVNFFIYFTDLECWVLNLPRVVAVFVRVVSISRAM